MFLLKKKKILERTSLLKDAGVLGAFIAALGVLVLAAFYVVYRLSSDRAYREKWKDYNDCGWA